MAKTKRIDIRVTAKEKQELTALASRLNTEVSTLMLVGAKFLGDNTEIARALLKKA